MSTHPDPEVEKLLRAYPAPPVQLELPLVPRRAYRPGLPTDAAGRKNLPLFTGPILYFPLAFAAIAEVCKAGNDQHNPGQPMHWAREKSTDQMDCALRHMVDHGMGNLKDTDGMWHLAKAAWRLLAELQLTIERSK